MKRQTDKGPKRWTQPAMFVREGEDTPIVDEKFASFPSTDENLQF